MLGHLRDVEVEGHFPRIRRILAEECPVLVSIDGDRLALERRYIERELEAALDDFAQFREASLGVLGALTDAAWSLRAISRNAQSSCMTSSLGWPSMTKRICKRSLRSWVRRRRRRSLTQQSRRRRLQSQAARCRARR
jgi:hypothetical protein